MLSEWCILLSIGALSRPPTALRLPHPTAPPPNATAVVLRERCEGQGPDPSHSDWSDQPSTHSGEAPPPHRSPLNLRFGEENGAEISHDPIGQAETPLKSRLRPPGGTASHLTGQPRDRVGVGFTGEWSVPSVTPAEPRPAALNLTCRLAAAVVRQRRPVGGALGVSLSDGRPGVSLAASRSAAAGSGGGHGAGRRGSLGPGGDGAAADIGLPRR